VVQFNFEDPAVEEAKMEAMRQELEADLAKIQTNEDEMVEADFEEGITPIFTKKPKRNDPCPCGSGEKYKNCCGKSGPKKGLLA